MECVYTYNSYNHHPSRSVVISESRKPRGEGSVNLSHLSGWQDLRVCEPAAWPAGNMGDSDARNLNPV